MAEPAFDPYVDDPIMIPGWSFGDRLRKARLMRGMDQRALARVLEVSPGAIGQWETDLTRPRNIAEVARRVQDVCRVPAWWLLDIEPINVESSVDEIAAARMRHRPDAPLYGSYSATGTEPGTTMAPTPTGEGQYAVVPPEGFEPPTSGTNVRRFPIERTRRSGDSDRVARITQLERVAR